MTAPPAPRAPDELARVLAPFVDDVRGLDGIDGPVAVACSGGADSLALLALAAAHGLRPVAVHIDHGIRPGSSVEAELVATHAAAVRAPTLAISVSVEPGPNLEARARDARYAALAETAATERLDAVLVGHTLDDQAETVLANLLRGGATAGLAGMAERRGLFIRPLLGLRRSDTVEICARLGWTPFDDPMNHDVKWSRVWLRREVLPTLERAAGRDLAPVLARQAGVLRDESDLLDRLATVAVPEPGSPLPVDAVLALDVALSRRAVRIWLGSPPPPLGDVDAVLDVARGNRRAVDLRGGRTVRRHQGMLVLTVTPVGT